MRKGDKGVIRATAKYCFGPVGRKGLAPGAEVEVPPDADLEYEAEVLDVYPPFNSKEAPIRARLSEAGLKKAHGNGFFHHEDYTRAIRCYQAAIKALDPSEVDEEEEETAEYKELVKIYCDVSNNLAAALMKLKRYKDVKEVRAAARCTRCGLYVCMYICVMACKDVCTCMCVAGAQHACPARLSSSSPQVVVKVIEVDPNNAKALYRGGVAAMRQDNYEEADMALKEAFKLAPTDPAVRSALKELARLKEEYRTRCVCVRACVCVWVCVCVCVRMYVTECVLVFVDMMDVSGGSLCVGRRGERMVDCRCVRVARFSVFMPMLQSLLGGFILI
jgi:tetratricopeptide (TPR) repeat protein